MKIKLSKDYRGIFDSIEDAITHYLIQRNIDKMSLWKFGINVFELSLYIEEYLITRNIDINNIANNFRRKQNDKN